MARSPAEDPRFNDIKHSTWNYHTETGENCTSGILTDLNQPPLSPKTPVLNDNMYTSSNSFANDVYMNKPVYNSQNGDSPVNMDSNMAFNNKQNFPRQNYGNAMLSLDNGRLVRVYYDENNQQLLFPYQLFNNNQGLCDVQFQNSHPPRFNDFSMNNNNVHNIPQPVSNTNYPQDNINNQSQVPTSNILKEVLGNLEPKPNPNGSYSPFGQNYPLNHLDTSLNILKNNSPLDVSLKQDNSPKRNENIPLNGTTNKKRIVAEVKPMRPTYSDILSKNAKSTPPEVARKVKQQYIETKQANNKSGFNKNDKPISNSKQFNDEKAKYDKKQSNMLSSGSESGDVNTDDIEKQHKSNRKIKNKRNNVSHKWCSSESVSKDGEDSFDYDNDSQFVFIENQSDKKDCEKKKNKAKISEKNMCEDDIKLDDEQESEFAIQENQQDISKLKKKKEKSYHKTCKPNQEKKKNTQAKCKRSKPRYIGLAQNYLEHWCGATWKALVWFFDLLCDICHMSAHLSFDLCTSVFTQTYVSSQAVWRSSKDWFYKFGDNKYLLYIDRKFGHTRFGFWRKLKWFKKEKDIDSSSDSTKLNTNIPLPATGEDAMKRLLACKGKDPYSILGVSVTCTDEEIKRYYRRQAFLVHPDKNQQPGAEEAFKILQHAFDLIGEPERREAYERRALESKHMEAAWSELNQLLTQLHDKMEFAANTIRCTNCGRRHKRVLTDRPCYAARYCTQCKIRHSAKEGDIWAESSMMGLLVMYYACMDGAVYQITQWASCQKKNLKQLRPDCHVVQYRIVLGNKATADLAHQTPSANHDPNLEEFLNNLYSKSGAASSTAATPAPPDNDAKKRRAKKHKPHDKHHSQATLYFLCFAPDMLHANSQ